MIRWGADGGITSALHAGETAPTAPTGRPDLRASDWGITAHASPDRETRQTTLTSRRHHQSTLLLKLASRMSTSYSFFY